MEELKDGIIGLQRAFLILLSASLAGGLFPPQVAAQHRDSPGVGVTVDSLHINERSADSLWRRDSIEQAKDAAYLNSLEAHHQLATMREIDLTNDGKPEELRISGRIASRIEDTRFEFSIKFGRKVLWKDSWTAAGYFDTIDHLSEEVKLHRLRRIISVFFANENFTVLDSADFQTLLRDGTPADVIPGSAIAAELCRYPRAMFSIFESRDYWYGLVWLPSQKRFVKAWRN